MSGLPKGWTKVPLIEVVSLVPTGVPTYQEEVEYFSTGSIQANGSMPEGVFKYERRPARANRWAIEGDVMQARMQGTNKALLISGGFSNKLFSTGFLHLRPNNHVCDSSFLRQFVASPEFLASRDDLATGSTQVALTDAGAQGLTITLPPVAEQYRIVAKLEVVLDKVDACQQRLTKIPVILKRFRQAVLAAACSGQLTADWREEQGRGEGEELPEGWSWSSLAEVCESVVDCPHSTPKWTVAGKLCVRTTNFKPGLLDLSEKQYVSETTFSERIQRLRPKPGDVLYSREGGILGIACIIPPDVELCLGQRMMLFRTHSGYRSELLMHWLNSPHILARVRELTGGSASPHLNVRDIKSFPTPLPPLHEQNEIVRRVEALFTRADQLEARYLKAKAHVDRLTPSILAKAFRGELVPQDENDEPAAALLERIRAQRSQAVQVGRHPAPQRSPRTPRTQRAAKPAALPLVAETPASYGRNIPQAILAHMQPGIEYSRADIANALGLSISDWNWAIRQLKEEGKVVQTGERKGARYRRP